MYRESSVTRLNFFFFFFFFFFFVDFSDGSHSFKGPAGIACHAFEHLIEVAFY